MNNTRKIEVTRFEMKHFLVKGQNLGPVYCHRITWLIPSTKYNPQMDKTVTHKNVILIK